MISRGFVCFSILVLVFVCAAGCLAQDSAVAAKASPLEIPMYPQAILEREANLTDETLLEGIKAGIASLAASVPKEPGEGPAAFLTVLDLETLSSAISAVKQVRMVQYALADGVAATPSKIAAFYDTELAKGEWTRVIWDVSSPRQAMALYSLPAAAGMFVIHAQTVQPKEGTAKTTVHAVRSVGSVDIPKMMSWFGKVMATFGAAQKKPEPPAGAGDKAEGPEPAK